jgi:tRNA A37 threonylcarbamoyladenosine biosynthesis protein TsaE
MGSFENIVKIEEIRRRVEEGDLLSAQKILDTMEIKKIKHNTDLSLIAEVYTENERYEEAAELYLKIFDKTKTRKTLGQLIEVLIKLNNVEDAQYYLAKYQKIAPKDFYNYILRYKIDKLKGESYENLIETLKTLKNTEYTEKWAYELAKLYYKAGMEVECIRECSDIILWFGEGTYVEKAKILRSYYSGETDKDRIMEEIKRRAEEVSLQMDMRSQESEPEEDQNADTENFVSAPGIEEDLYSDTDFMVQNEADDFEDGLKKDVQYILIEEQPEEALVEANHEPYEDNTYVGPEILREEADNGYSQLTEKEREEQEVEETIYQLLEEEKQSEGELDEEDRKLIQLANVLQINPEELFGNFLHVVSVKKQLVKSLEMILQEQSKTLFLIITGSVGTGKTILAKDIALFLYKSGRLKSPKVAKINADKLNSVDILAKKDTLRDCCLLVENASELKRQTIDSLLELSLQLRGDLAIIFEEDKKNMNKLFRECPKLMDLLKNRIHLPQYSTEDLVGFALACISQKDYRLDTKAEALLQNKINQIARQTEPHRHLEQICGLMQSAMNAADIRMGKQLSDLTARGRLKDVEILSVLPEDFMN